MAESNPNNMSSYDWYFGYMTRAEANDVLSEETQDGVFLIRDSITKLNDFVLCVRENKNVKHYIINTLSEGTRKQYQIGEQRFDDLPQLIQFYKYHYVDTINLLKPASRPAVDVIAKHDFAGKEAEDLPFRRGEILTVTFKQEEKWWTAKNSRGQVGLIPAPYVQRLPS